MNLDSLSIRELEDLIAVCTNQKKKNFDKESSSSTGPEIDSSVVTSMDSSIDSSLNSNKDNIKKLGENSSSKVVSEVAKLIKDITGDKLVLSELVSNNILKIDIPE